MTGPPGLPVYAALGRGVRLGGWGHTEDAAVMEVHLHCEGWESEAGPVVDVISRAAHHGADPVGLARVALRGALANEGTVPPWTEPGGLGGADAGIQLLVDGHPADARAVRHGAWWAACLCRDGVDVVVVARDVAPEDVHLGRLAQDALPSLV